MLILMLIITFAFGLVAIAIGIGYGIYWYRHKPWNSFVGEIVAVREDFEGNDFSYFPTIRVLHSGQTYEFESDFGSYPSPNIGDRRSVVLKPDGKRFSKFGLKVFILTVLLPILIGAGIAVIGWSTYQANKTPNKKSEISTLRKPSDQF